MQYTRYELNRRFLSKYFSYCRSKRSIWRGLVAIFRLSVPLEPRYSPTTHKKFLELVQSSWIVVNTWTYWFSSSRHFSLDIWFCPMERMTWTRIARLEQSRWCSYVKRRLVDLSILCPTYIHPKRLGIMICINNPAMNLMGHIYCWI